MDRRRENRLCHRLACRLALNGGLYQGLVLDVSRSGLFVQMRAKAARQASAPVTVEVRSTRADESITVSALVARQYWEPDPLFRWAKGGMGLRVIEDSAGWLGLLDEIARREEPVFVNGQALRPPRQTTRTRCSECGRERTTLWSEVCGWCSGRRPRRRSDSELS
jgi:hypothetical protein